MNMKTVTDAPESYDGFGTETIETLGMTKKGPVRKVDTPEVSVDWQRQRYASGLYLYCSLAQWEEIKDLILIEGEWGKGK
jgi:hypothetical protein